MGSVRIVLDKEMTGKDGLSLLKIFQEKNKLPIFKGKVEHAYESDFLKAKDRCPRCGSPTQHMMSNFAYATGQKSRILSGEAGHFCTKCPTVIIDDDVMRAGIDRKRFEYHGVFTIETGNSEEPGIFKTLNGEKTLYILGEEQDVLGISQSIHQSDPADDYRYIQMGGPGNKSFAKKRSQGLKNKKRKGFSMKSKVAKKKR